MLHIGISAARCPHLIACGHPPMRVTRGSKQRTGGCLQRSIRAVTLGQEHELIVHVTGPVMLLVCRVTLEPTTILHSAGGASNHFDESGPQLGLFVASAARGTEPSLSRDLHVTHVDLPHLLDCFSVQPHEYLILLHAHVPDSPVEEFLLG